MVTKEQLDQIWHEAGLKYRFRRFHKFLSERGLLSHITEDKLTSHLYEVLENFLVKGIKETKDGEQILPTSSGGPERLGESEATGRTGWRRASN